MLQAFDRLTYDAGRGCGAALRVSFWPLNAQMGTPYTAARDLGRRALNRSHSMSIAKKRLLKLLAIATCGTTFQLATEPSGCGLYGLYTGLAALDFCQVFNCTGGSFFNFCDPVAIFVDCL
jgi:hypothetical protein